jgi:uncharacterized alpha/beta hydrolase family protein
VLKKIFVGIVISLFSASVIGSVTAIVWSIETKTKVELMYDDIKHIRSTVDQLLLRGGK